MSLFVRDSAACEKSGFLDAYYKQSDIEIIKLYQKQYNAIIHHIVPFIDIVLNGQGQENDKVGLGLVESPDPRERVAAIDRIDPNANYTLEVMKFEPKVTVGFDVTWPDAENFSIGNFSDIQDGVKELIELGKQDKKSLSKIIGATVWGMEIAKDFWGDYPLKIASDYAHMGVSFSPKGIHATLDQAYSSYKKTGQFARVEHPNIDPIKYVWQVFHGHNMAHLGTASVAVSDIRKFANAGLGVYTSLALVVRKGGKNGPIIDSFVYPYTRQDHGLLTLDELKTLYKGNFTSVDNTKRFTGYDYINFLEQHKELHLDEVLQAKRLRKNYISEVNSLLGQYFPEPEKLDPDIKMSKAERKLNEQYVKERTEFREKIFNKIEGYVVAVDSAKDLNIEQKNRYKNIVSVELKIDILRIAVEELGYDSTLYKKILEVKKSEIDEAQKFKKIKNAVDNAFEEFSDLTQDRVMSSAEYGKLRQSPLYKFRERFASFPYEDFVREIATGPELDLMKFRRKLFGDLEFNRRVAHIVEEHTFPLMRGYKGIQDLSLDDKMKFKDSIKVQMKYDFLKFAVTEFGYKNETLERISEERKYKVFDIFRKENKHELVAEEIESIYNEFINDDRLERFEIPEGRYAREYIKANRAEMEFTNPDLYRYQDEIKGIDFDDFYEYVEDLVVSKDLSDTKTKEVVKKVSLATCEDSVCDFLRFGGYNVDEGYVESIKAIDRRKVFSSLEDQDGKPDKAKPFSSASDSLESFEISVGSDTEKAIETTKGIFRNYFTPQIPKVNRDIPDRLKKVSFPLSDAKSCMHFDYGRTILELQTLFLQLKENSIFIDFLKFEGL